MVEYGARYYIGGELDGELAEPQPDGPGGLYWPNYRDADACTVPSALGDRLLLRHLKFGTEANLYVKCGRTYVHLTRITALEHLAA